MGKLGSAIRAELGILGEFFRWLRPGHRGRRWGLIGAATMSLYSATFTADRQGALTRLGYAAAGAVGGGLLGLRMEQHYDDGPWSKRFITLGAALLIGLAVISVGDALVT